MNKKEFIQRLEAALVGVSTEEKVAALQYYTEYLDEAGPDSEEEVLKELGTPEDLAQEIRASSGEEDGWKPPEPDVKTEKSEEAAGEDDAKTSFKQEEQSVNAPPFSQTQSNYYNNGHQQNSASSGEYNAAQTTPNQPNSWAKPLAIVLLICFAPAIISVVSGVFAALAGLAVALVVMVAVPFILGIVFVFCASIMLVLGVQMLALAPPSGILLIGASVLLFGLGGLLIYAGVALVRKVIPWLVNSIKNLVLYVVNFFKKKASGLK